MLVYQIPVSYGAWKPLKSLWWVELSGVGWWFRPLYGSALVKLNNSHKDTSCRVLVTYFLRLSKKWHFISAEMRWPFHSGRNEMNSISFWPKWASHFGQNEMYFISFRPKWNDHFISAKIILSINMLPGLCQTKPHPPLPQMHTHKHTYLHFSNAASDRVKDHFTSFIVVYTLSPNYSSFHLPRLHKNQDDLESIADIKNQDDVVLAYTSLFILVICVWKSLSLWMKYHIWRKVSHRHDWPLTDQQSIRPPLPSISGVSISAQTPHLSIALM